MQKVEFNRMEQWDYSRKEAYKSIRANIQFTGEENRVICFTSCTQGEGKTTTVFSMARVFAESGKKVIFVDADLRKSVVTDRYSTGKIRVGMAQVLSKQKPLDDAICETNIENMDAIFIGDHPSNPSELLGSSEFREMIAVLRERYDFVLIDTPPLGAVIDAALVASVSDASVFVVQHNKISCKFARKVIEQLEQSGCRVVGAIMTKMPVLEGAYYNSRYGKYYGRVYERIHNSFYGRYYGRYYGKYYDRYLYGYSYYGHEEEKQNKDR
ncbi:MAG: CpsD/CapB family tyrosine-protein kinase [Lachnospiraceae bacterium]